jgi:hypothetical protein
LIVTSNTSSEQPNTPDSPKTEQEPASQAFLKLFARMLGRRLELENSQREELAALELARRKAQKKSQAGS